MHPLSARKKAFFARKLKGLRYVAKELIMCSSIDVSFQAFLFISSKKVIGCVIAVPIKMVSLKCIKCNDNEELEHTFLQSILLHA